MKIGNKIPIIGAKKEEKPKRITATIEPNGDVKFINDGMNPAEVITTSTSMINATIKMLVNPQKVDPIKN